ncbi:[FeFe] hydrogenase H-cluster radical SAM maturase HydE [Tissierella sp. MSJ-40]|uniref:[FeFe] hydrogenase H-cluster radical SAM maturase HydE n=1 Tax=Tissierella simiarum TaxID=2841534 RepID=A0ABS6E332_9FIRM|nr:[FeFe] hydrogenase H-cluster radical SAM maturase HydE [Tissierella simiarum]MBU5437326.1 [FeFe] hydrogenase H-cluster radical SAM maturase HydE [Tissierella simiarum]
MKRNELTIKKLINKLYKSNELEWEELLYILNHIGEYGKEYLIQKAHETRMKVYGDRVFMRGLIEFTNYCKKGCIYCGIGAFNKNVDRYRLGLEEILLCCDEGYKLGYRTFVLQGGEDNFYSDDKIEEIIEEIKNRYKDTAITLSIGEKSYESYEKYFNAGVDRYLLRHETASKELFEKIHTNSNYENRIQCLWNLKKIGYQVGAGFMVGIPTQTKEDLIKDIFFLKELDPEMVGIGPFIPHKDTVFHNEEGGTLEDTIIMLALLRLFLPYVLLPATTALGTIHPFGREQGIKAGANVVMPNLSPIGVREKYSLYNGKICTGDEAAECRGCIQNRIEKAGFSVDMSRGDNIKWRR